MSAQIPVAFKPLLSDELKTFASLGTLFRDGSPQVTPIWFDTEGENIRINSAQGRAKDGNIRRDPRVALTVMDPTNPYRYIQIRGRVTKITEEGADAHIDRLAKKYMGLDTYPMRTAGETRVIYVITPERVTTMG